MKEIAEEPGLQAQVEFFSQIKEKLSPSLSLVAEIEDALNISTDSAYRRIRGEKELSFSEIQKLVEKFGIEPRLGKSAATGGDVCFRYSAINPYTFTLKDYLNSANEKLEIFVRHGDVELYYAAKDIPLFHYFIFDEIAIFKMFVWQKSLCGFPQFEGRLFSMKEYDPELLKAGKKCLDLYNTFNSIEMWNEDTIISILKQLEFYYEAGWFKEKKEAEIVADKLGEYLEYLQKMTETGSKYSDRTEERIAPGRYEMYHNEIVRSDNTILAVFTGGKAAFMTHSGFNFLTTFNQDFCNNIHHWLINLMKRSSMISRFSEKQRSQFFSALFARLEATRAKMARA